MKPILSNHFRSLLSVVFCICFAVNINAQAVNDNCSSATVLTSSTSCNPVTSTFIGATLSSTADAVVVTYTTAGAGTFVCPANISALKVECWGGGGAGGGATASNSKGGGGGGGAYTVNNSVAVVPSTTYNLSVGNGGTGGTGNGGNGSTSTFTSASPVSSGGGFGGGGAASSGATGTGNSGGTTSAGGTLTVGSSGTSATATTSGSGGASPLGGAGGAGLGLSNSNGNPGIAFGGGGGGAYKQSGGASYTGGTGAKGAVQLTLYFGDKSSPDVWFKFTAASVNPTIVLSNIDNNLQAKSPYIQLLGGTCGSLTNLATSTTSTLSASGLSIGTTYYIRITTNTNFASPVTGNYTFDICVQDPLAPPVNSIDYSKSYINITDRTTGGTINQNDLLEIRATLVVKGGTITNVSYYDTLKRNAGFIFVDSISTRTNEGKNFATFTNALDADAGYKAVIPVLLDTSIQINIGTGATAALGGSLTSNTSLPSLFNSTCIIMATYRVRVDTGLVGYGRKINFGGGAFKYNIGVTTYTISFPRDSLIIYPTLTACSDAVSPANLIGTANNGNFGTLANGSSATGTQNGGPAAINTTYNYETYATGPNDYYYGITNNTSPTNDIVQTAAKPGATRVFQLWDVTGDHTGAVNSGNVSKGNKPCDPSLPVSATNPCGYMLTINSSYKTDKVFEYTATGACAETYYEVSAWFKNLCSRCGCDVNGKSSGSIAGPPYYIPTSPGDSSGVRPNIAMQIDGIDYYTTGEIAYQGIAGAPTATDTLNNWVRRSFVFKTGATQTSFKVTFRNNAPGGGGNDWAIDDIGLRTCYPSMVYAPANPIVYMGNSLTLTDTVRSYFPSYFYYKWQRKTPSGVFTDIPDVPVGSAAGIANPVYVSAINQYQYAINYTIPGTQTLAANSGDLYQMVVATTLANLSNGCVSPSAQGFGLYPADAPCAFADTNYAVAPQTGNIDWNRLPWSLGHVPTCCESAQITYTGTSATADVVTVDITNDICIINLTLINNSTKPSQLFKTILHPGYNMQMNGHVRMGAPATSATDSCIFLAQGGGTITVNGNTVIGYPSDLSTSIIGTLPGTATYANYLLKGDSLTFNTKAFTNHKFTAVTLDPTTGSAVLVNNTNAVTYPTAVTFDKLKIGNTSAKTVTTAGTNQNSFMNDNGGNLEVTAGSTLIMPANYSINAKDFVTTGTYINDLFLRANSTLSLGGISGGIAGSNFPANFTNYTLDPTSTVIFNGAAQTIPGSLAKFVAYGNITLSGTGVKTATLSSNINLAGNLYRKNGGHTFNANSGRFTFTSAINAQKYYADAGATPINFYDFTNNNTHTLGLSIDSTVGILNELELKVATKTTLNTGDIIMRSAVGRTSHITNLGTTIPAIVYNSTYRFVVERYLFGQKSWRFLASPVQLLTNDATTPTVSAAWRENASALSSSGYGTAITGPSGPNGEIDYYSQRGSMKFYNDVANVWTELTNTTGTKIANKPGYMVYVRGDRGAPNTSAGAGGITNLRIKGQIRTGDQIYNVLANKFQAIGNPYASQFNFSTVTKSNIANSFIVWNPILFGFYGVGGYENYSLVGGNYRLNGLAGGAIRNTIESGEAFFVQNNTASAGTVTIKEADKGILSSLVSRTVNNDVTTPTIDISLLTKTGTDNFLLVDGVSTSFGNSYSNGIDNDDVIKFTNSNDNLVIKSNSKDLVVERRPTLTITDTIRLGISATHAAGYRFKVEPFLLDNIDVEAFLVDKYLRTETAISLADSTNYNFDITADAASKAIDRFMIVFKQSPLISITKIAASRNVDKTVTVNWDLSIEKNVNNYTVEQSNDGNNFNAIANQVALVNNGSYVTYNKIDNTASKSKNWYRVKSTSKGGTVTYSAVVMVNEIGDAKISVYPNPTTAGKINLYLQNQNAGLYNVQITNKDGQVLKTATINVTSINQQNTISLGAAAAGTYQIKITNNEGEKTTLSFIVE